MMFPVAGKKIGQIIGQNGQDLVKENDMQVFPGLSDCLLRIFFLQCKMYKMENKVRLLYIFVYLSCVC